MIDLLRMIWGVVDGIPWWTVLLLLGLVWIFRRDFPALMQRVKRVKVPGVELEFYEDLDRLQTSANQAAEDVASKVETRQLSGSTKGTSLATGSITTEKRTSSGSQAAAIDLADSGTLKVGESATVQAADSSEAIIRRILDEAVADPKVALIRLSLEIERELRLLLGSAGFLDGRSYLPMRKAVETLRRQYPVLPANILDAIEAFWEVRNHIIHGGEGNRDDVVRAIDSGLVVLKTLHGLPKVRFLVYHPGTEVYADSAGEEVRQGVRAVIVEQISAGGLMRTKHVHPTTRSHFTEGMQVAWEWNMDSAWPESWYRDPDTGAVKYAWTSSAEFVGRDLSAIGELQGDDATPS